jgi:SAM-dependent methyltransferase
VKRERWDERYSVPDPVWTSRPNRFLVAEAEGLLPARALDLACGEGRNALWLAERGWRVTGVDFSTVGLDTARRLTAERGVECDWLAADLLDYRPPARAFELVLLFYLQVPAGERTAIVQRAAEAVSARGVFLLVAHDSQNIAAGYGGPKDPAVLYTAEDVAGDLEPSGLTIVRAERVRRPVETDEGERVALDALVRAERR